jgi:hypothetical protein
MLKDNTLVCDACQKTITRVTQVPPEGWPTMHNLCSACFIDLWKTSLTPA